MATLGMVKGRVRVVVVMDWAILGAFLVVCNCMLTVWVGVRASVLFTLALEDLDARLAEAIRSVLEGAGGNFEPVNPVQSAIAQFITTRLAEGPEIPVEVSRGLDGKFSR